MLTLWSKDVCERVVCLLERIASDNALPPVDMYFHNKGIVAFCDDNRGNRVKYSSVRLPQVDGSTRVVVVQECGDFRTADGGTQQEVAKMTELYEAYLRDMDRAKCRRRKHCHPFPDDYIF